MARIIGTPGESAYVRGALSVLLPVLLLFAFVFLPAWYALAHYATRWGFLGVLLVAATVAASWWWRRKDLRNTLHLIREGANFLKGAHGEIHVHEVLKSLPPEYVVFHDFHPVGRDGKRARWNVDHVVVGPTGVFVIDAKNYTNPRVQRPEQSSFARKNVKQVQRNAMELKQKLVTWSAGELSGLFVVPVVVYTQEGAHVDLLREGPVRTLPLRLLRSEIVSHSEASIDQIKAGRVARVLFSQLPPDLRNAFAGEMTAYGELTKSALYAARDARLAEQAALSSAASSAAPPERCPRCNGRLVRRTARKGPRAGKPFLGCENYRTTGCSFGFNLD